MWVSGDPSSSSSSEDDWGEESEDSYLVNQQKKNRHQGRSRDDPLLKFQKAQLRDIQDKIRRMVGRELVYAANYRGAKDSGSNIPKFSGGYDYEEFIEWLGRILLHFLNNRMCSPDNEMMMGNGDGVLSQWQSEAMVLGPRDKRELREILGL